MRRELRAQSIEDADRRKLFGMFPDTGPLRRELYPRHLEFFKLGTLYRERLFMAANRVGKTEGAGGYESALHVTGLYPHWWEGRTFNRGVRWWAAGRTNTTTRDIIQAKLFGPVQYRDGRKWLAGTGLIPGDAIADLSWKRGVEDLLDYAHIRHKGGGLSTLALKSYEQGPGAFEGTEQDGIWLDEEPPLDVYTECLIRTMTTDGIVVVTFTPLEGLSEVVLSFLEDAVLPENLAHLSVKKEAAA